MTALSEGSKRLGSTVAQRAAKQFRCAYRCACSVAKMSASKYNPRGASLHACKTARPRWRLLADPTHANKEHLCAPPPCNTTAALLALVSASTTGHPCMRNPTLQGVPCPRCARHVGGHPLPCLCSPATPPSVTASPARSPPGPPAPQTSQTLAAQWAGPPPGSTAPGSAYPGSG